MIPLVSIIVTCYNYGEYVEECLRSIEQQTFEQWECIIVDDGSTDDTKIRIAPFLIDLRFRYIWQENGNVSKARNYGLGHAQGKYVICLDADDYVSLNFIKELYEKIADLQPVDLVYPRVQLFGARNEQWDLAPYSYHDLLENNMIVVAAMYERQKFIDLGGYDQNMKTGAEDWEYWIRLLNINSIVLKVTDAVLHYRIKKESKNDTFLVDREKKLNNLRYITTKNRDIYTSHFESPLVLAHFLKEYKDREIQSLNQQPLSLRARLNRKIAKIFKLRQYKTHQN